MSEQFEVKSGVRQGCILSPVLFLLAVNDVLEAALNPLATNFNTFDFDRDAMRFVLRFESSNFSNSILDIIWSSLGHLRSCLRRILPTQNTLIN